MVKYKKQYPISKYLIIFIIAVFTFIGGITLGYIGNLVKDLPALSKEEIAQQIKNASENSDIYFENGEKVVTINSELMRKSIPLEEMGDNIKNAIIASEDANFYKNMGIEPLAILKATYKEIRGTSNSGGSTITQQLVKNQLLDTSRSYERKAKEILLSIRLNNNFSKEEILETYLNIAPFGKNKLGQNISGIETASLGVFGIRANELNIAQAAYLAGFVQLPFKYTPFDGNGELRSDEELQAGFDRQQYVLNRMYKENFITKEEYNEALDFDIKASFLKTMPNDNQKYPYIQNEIITAASEILAKQTAEKNNELDKFNSDFNYRNDLIDKSRTRFLTGGYKVTTTINKELYDTLEEAKNKFGGFIPKFIKGKNYDMEIGATVIENSTGRVLAFIGGRDFSIQQLNHATRTTRSPGSTIKPLLVYAPAIDKGYITPNSSLLDKRFNYHGWSPENFAKVEFGIIPARNALAKSLNLSTIRLYSAFYNENPVKEYLEKMDFKNLTETDYNSLSAAIGGLSYGVTVTENTNAFATLANKGKFKQAHIIDEIKNRNGDVIYKANFEEKEVYKEETSYLIMNMLNDVIKPIGTASDIASQLSFNRANLFVKTGTSEYNNDSWVVGGTTKITFGLWTGYDEPSPLPTFTNAHNQWAYFMNIIHKFSPKLLEADTPFEKPINVVNKGINPYNNNNGSIYDLVPNFFVPLDNQKTLKKFGLIIDPNTYSNLVSPKPKEDKDKDKDKEKDKKKEEKEENQKEKIETPTATNDNNQPVANSNTTNKVTVVAKPDSEEIVET